MMTMRTVPADTGAYDVCCSICIDGKRAPDDLERDQII